MSTEEFDYDRDLDIDPDYLDAECLNHPKVFMKYAKASAAANRVVSELEEQIKVKRSQLLLDATDDPTLLGLKKDAKPNAAQLEAYYREHNEHKALKKEWLDAKETADLLINAVFAFQARKSMLENLVKLHGQNYFSSPEVRDLPEAQKRLNEMKEDRTERNIVGRTGRRR